MDKKYKSVVFIQTLNHNKIGDSCLRAQDMGMSFVSFLCLIFYLFVQETILMEYNVENWKGHGQGSIYITQILDT